MVTILPALFVLSGTSPAYANCAMAVGGGTNVLFNAVIISAIITCIVTSSRRKDPRLAGFYAVVAVSAILAALATSFLPSEEAFMSKYPKELAAQFGGYGMRADYAMFREKLTMDSLALIALSALIYLFHQKLFHWRRTLAFVFLLLFGLHYGHVWFFVERAHTSISGPCCKSAGPLSAGKECPDTIYYEASCRDCVGRLRMQDKAAEPQAE